MCIVLLQYDYTLGNASAKIMFTFGPLFPEPKLPEILFLGVIVKDNLDYKINCGAQSPTTLRAALFSVKEHIAIVELIKKLN